MAGNEFQFPAPTNSNYAADIANNTTIVEEGPKICPLCSSVVRLYYVDFFTRIFMCTNMLCEYPFGSNFKIHASYDEGPCLRYGIDLSRLPRRRYQMSTKSMGQPLGTSTIATNSNLSSSEWAELNPPSQTYDSDDNMSTTSSNKIFSRKASQRLIEKRAKKQEDEKHIKQKVEKIKECNKVLFDGREDSETIRNAKWIQNLSTMQSSSGKRLVKDHELQKLKQTQDKISHGELKIDIDAKKDSMSSIVIEIGNVAGGNNGKPV